MQIKVAMKIANDWFEQRFIGAQFVFNAGPVAFNVGVFVLKLTKDAINRFGIHILSMLKLTDGRKQLRFFMVHMNAQFIAKFRPFLFQAARRVVHQGFKSAELVVAKEMMCRVYMLNELGYAVGVPGLVVIVATVSQTEEPGPKSIGAKLVLPLLQ